MQPLAKNVEKNRPKTFSSKRVTFLRHRLV